MFKFDYEEAFMQKSDLDFIYLKQWWWLREI